MSNEARHWDASAVPQAVVAVSTGQGAVKCAEGTHLHSFRKFLQASGQSSVYRSTTMSPLLVSSSTAMPRPLFCAAVPHCSQSCSLAQLAPQAAEQATARPGVRLDAAGPLLCHP